MKYNIDENNAIELLEGFYKGTKILYDKVQLLPNEEDDELTLEFNYDIIEYKAEMTDKEPEVILDQIVGDLLQQLIYEGLEKQSIVYHGGTE